MADPRIDIPPIGSSVSSLFDTLVANLDKAKASGYEFTEDQLSPAEVNLGAAMKEDGLRFEQQKQIGPYFADFYLPSFGLVVEVDGAAYHQDEEREKRRDKCFRDHGMRVVHLRALKVFHDVYGCLEEIRAAL